MYTSLFSLLALTAAAPSGCKPKVRGNPSERAKVFVDAPGSRYDHRPVKIRDDAWALNGHKIVVLEAGDEAMVNGVALTSNNDKLTLNAGGDPISARWEGSRLVVGDSDTFYVCGDALTVFLSDTNEGCTEVSLRRKDRR